MFGSRKLVNAVRQNYLEKKMREYCKSRDYSVFSVTINEIMEIFWNYGLARRLTRTTQWRTLSLTYSLRDQVMYRNLNKLCKRLQLKINDRVKLAIIKNHERFKNNLATQYYCYRILSNNNDKRDIYLRIVNKIMSEWYL